MKTFTVTAPGLRLQTGLNAREHWRARYKRVAAEKTATVVALCAVSSKDAAVLKAAPRVAVRIVRTGGNLMDLDNLQGATKAVRDAVAKWLGKGDQPGSGVEWYYAQRPGRRAYSVEIELTAFAATDAPDEVAILKARIEELEAQLRCARA